MYSPYYIPEPKYWNEKTKKVVVDDVVRDPISLESILGTYRWFYFQFSNRDGDIEPNSGYITLDNESDLKTTAARVSGSLQLHVYSGTFHGLRKAEEKETRRVGNQKYRKNFWEIKVDWEGGDDMGEEVWFGVCEVKDDNGNPFLKLEWGDEEEVVCHGGAEFGFYVGKKVSSRKASDEECGLTEDEEIKLGMVLTEREVEELATKGYISTDSVQDSDEEDTQEISREDTKKAVKKEDVKKEEVKEETETFLKRRLSTDEKEEISSSEARKKARKV